MTLFHTSWSIYIWLRGYYRFILICIYDCFPRYNDYVVVTSSAYTWPSLTVCNPLQQFYIPVCSLASYALALFLPQICGFLTPIDCGILRLIFVPFLRQQLHALATVSPPRDCGYDCGMWFDYLCFVYGSRTTSYKYLQELCISNCCAYRRWQRINFICCA